MKHRVQSTRFALDRTRTCVQCGRIALVPYSRAVRVRAIACGDFWISAVQLENLTSRQVFGLGSGNCCARWCVRVRCAGGSCAACTARA